MTSEFTLPPALRIDNDMSRIPHAAPSRTLCSAIDDETQTNARAYRYQKHPFRLLSAAEVIFRQGCSRGIIIQPYG